MAEVTLTSKDEREFKVNAQVAIMSETVKSMMGVEDGEEIDPPEAAIPLPAVEGNILELVLKYCNYHSENKETKEEEKNTWDQEFVKVDDDTLFSLILVSQPRPSLPPLGPTYCGLQTRSVQTSRSSGRSHDKVAVAATSGTAGFFVPTVPEACQLTHFHFP